MYLHSLVFWYFLALVPVERRWLCGHREARKGLVSNSMDTIVSTEAPMGLFLKESRGLLEGSS